MKRAAHPMPRRCRQLAKLKSIGTEIATVLVGEVFYRPFNNRRELGAMSGWLQARSRAEAMARDQGISKAGNAKARTTMIELAWLWLRNQPESALASGSTSMSARSRVGSGGSPIVALARKLLVALWRFLETGLVPDGAAAERLTATGPRAPN